MLVLGSRLVKLYIVTALLTVSGAYAAVATPTALDLSKVLSFKEWKSDKSTEVRERYSKLESEYITKKAANPKDRSLKALYSDLKSTKSHIDEIGELTVSDYFVGYLSRFKDQKKAFNAAAGKLDSSEVSELMTAYADSLLKTTGEGISTTQPAAQPSTTGEASK